MAYDWERDEWWREVSSMSEAEREIACGHSRWNSGKQCPDCGTSADDD